MGVLCTTMVWDGASFDTWLKWIITYLHKDQEGAYLIDLIHTMRTNG